MTARSFGLSAPTSHLALALALAACSPGQRDVAASRAEDPPAPAPADARKGEGLDAQALARAQAAATGLAGRLKGRLMAAMSEGGPPAALEVCTAEGQSLTREVQASQGVAVGRSSLRLRNPANAAPAWVQTWLDAQGEGAVSEARGFERVDEVGDRRLARVLRPIAVEPPCLACHGPSEALAPEIRAGLTEHYPEDRAVGYATGDLRGALWAEAEVGEASAGG